MRITRASAEDAISIYILTNAYLYDAPIGNFSSASTLHAKEGLADVFYIWHPEESSVQEEPTTSGDPVAVCTYTTTTKTWKVELSNGEKLTLLDKGAFWDVAGVTQTLPLSSVVKKQGRWTGARIVGTNANGPLREFPRQAVFLRT